MGRQREDHAGASSGVVAAMVTASDWVLMLHAYAPGSGPSNRAHRQGSYAAAQGFRPCVSCGPHPAPDSGA